MWAATAWDDDDWDGVHARGWTVMGRLREQQRTLATAAARVRREHAEEARTLSTRLMTASDSQESAQREMRARWKGGAHVVAMLFAPPDTPAIRSLDARRDSFDARTGNAWDLFFPGYHHASDDYFESQAGSRRVGHDLVRDWYFNAGDFEIFRREIERAASGRWRYSGGADLVVAMGYMPDRGPIVMDWESTLSGSLTNPDGSQSFALSNVIERLSQDLESGTEDPHFGLAEVFDRMPEGTSAGTLKSFLIGVLTSIAAQVAKDELHL